MRIITLFIFIILFCFKTYSFQPYNTSLFFSYDCYVEDIVGFVYNPKKAGKVYLKDSNNKNFKLYIWQHNINKDIAISMDGNDEVYLMWDSSFSKDPKGPWIILEQFFVLNYIDNNKDRFHFYDTVLGDIGSKRGFSPGYLFEGICKRIK